MPYKIDIQMQSSFGGSFVNSGNYGCVFNPPIQCARKKNASELANAAGKIFQDNEAFLDEYGELLKIRKLDPKNAFTVPYIGHCKVNKKNFKPTDETDKCTRHILPSQDKYTQLIYKFGGINLNEYYKYPTRYPIYYEDLIRLTIPIFEGIKQMGSKQYAHVDIKPENMLLDNTIPKVYLIDFGLLTPFKLLKHETHFHDHEYPYYPPEFKVLSLMRKGIYTVDNATKEFLTNFRFYNEDLFMKWIERYWPMYPKALKHFFEKFKQMKLADVENEYDSHFAKLIDSYGLAMTIIEVTYRLINSKNLRLKTPKSTIVKQLMSKVLLPMIHPDAYKRMSVEDALPLLKSILTTVPPVTPPVVVPSPPASPVSTPAPPQKIPLDSPPSPVKPPLSLAECVNLKTKEIQGFLKDFKLPVYGTKAILCQRLMDYIRTNPPYTQRP